MCTTCKLNLFFSAEIKERRNYVKSQLTVVFGWSCRMTVLKIQSPKIFVFLILLLHRHQLLCIALFLLICFLPAKWESASLLIFFLKMQLLRNTKFLLNSKVRRCVKLLVLLLLLVLLILLIVWGMGFGVYGGRIVHKV